MKQLVAKILIALAAVSGVGLVTASPEADADAASYIYALEHSSVAVYTGPRVNFVNMGVRVCNDLYNGFSLNYIADNLVAYWGMDYVAAWDVIAKAQIHLC